MSVFAIMRHASEHLADAERDKVAKEIARQLISALPLIGAKAPSTISVVTSPIMRAKTTAESFASFFKRGTAMVVEDEMFSDTVDVGSSELLDGREAIIERVGEKMDPGNLVLVVTHLPLVRRYFDLICEGYFGKGDRGYLVPNYRYGVHAINLKTRQQVSFGTY